MVHLPPVSLSAAHSLNVKISWCTITGMNEQVSLASLAFHSRLTEVLAERMRVFKWESASGLLCMLHISHAMGVYHRQTLCNSSIVMCKAACRQFVRPCESCSRVQHSRAATSDFNRCYATCAGAHGISTSGPPWRDCLTA